jgi:hypothetical protein
LQAPSQEKLPASWDANLEEKTFDAWAPATATSHDAR